MIVHDCGRSMGVHVNRFITMPNRRHGACWVLALALGLLWGCASEGGDEGAAEVLPSDVAESSGADVEGQPAETDTEDGIVDLTIELAPPESGYQLVTEPSIVPAGSEVEICSVIRVEAKGDETLFWAHEMESLISDGSHHMNVLLGQFSFYDAFLGDDAFEAQLGIGLGSYDCNQFSNIMEKASPIFPSQRTNQRITFPEGVGVPMMVPLVLIFHHHYINPTDKDVRINAALNIIGMPEEEVTDVGYLIFDGDSNLDIPGKSQTTEAQTCVVNRDVEFALVSTHTHEKGDCATLSNYSGATGTIAESPFYVNKYWEAPPILHFDRGEFQIAAGEGVHYACHYRNHEDRDLGFGPSANDEMCVFAAVAYPAPRSKAEIKAVFAEADLVKVLELANELFTACDELVEVESPWPMAGAPNFGDYDGVCRDLIQTESNTLW